MNQATLLAVLLGMLAAAVNAGEAQAAGTRGGDLWGVGKDFPTDLGLGGGGVGGRGGVLGGGGRSGEEEAADELYHGGCCGLFCECEQRGRAGVVGGDVELVGWN